jgi:predicted alpha/beta-fold hydrolase
MIPFGVTIVWQERDYRIDICRVTKGGHIEHLSGRTETWSVSPSVDMLPFGVTTEWQEHDYRIDICRVTKGGHIEHLSGRTETWSVSPSVDMLPFSVTIPATVPHRSEIPERLMNYPVFTWISLNHLKTCIYPDLP